MAQHEPTRTAAKKIGDITAIILMLGFSAFLLFLLVVAGRWIWHATT